MNNAVFSSALVLVTAACSGTPPSKTEQIVVETVADGVVHIDPEWRTPPDVVAHTEQHGLTGRRIQIEPGVELFVIEEGDGVPLVLLNGGPGNSLQSFVPHFSRAAEFARVIYYDPRGVGRSSWEPGPDAYSTPQAIADLEALREALGIERWAVLGWSWGGLLAQLYTLQHPDRVLGLALIASSQSMGLERNDDTYPDNLSPAEHARVRAIYSRDGARVVPRTSATLSPAEVRALVYNGYRNGDWKRQFYYRPSDERMAHVAQHEWVHDVDYNARLSATSFDRDLSGAFADFNRPVLLVYGAWDMTFSREMPARLAAQFPDSALHVFERASHNPFAEQPQAFFGLLERWLARLMRDTTGSGDAPAGNPRPRQGSG